MLSGIRDNLDRGTVAQFLRKKIAGGVDLSIVSAYFTIYAFAALKQELSGIHRLRFLFGEPRFIRRVAGATERKAFDIEEQGLALQNRLRQRPLAKECAAWIEDKVEIRSIKQSNLLHGKLYHISRNGVDDAIVGSSNFTASGLGVGGEQRNNIELNLIVNDRRDLEDLKAWFDELWANDVLVEDVKAEVLRYLAQLYQNNAPEFIYYKTLFHLFQQFLADQDASGMLAEQSQVVESQIWNALFEFQKDGVKGAINKILAYNGCIIADSVGLGKTFEALAVIKYFELRNERVLVLCPKKLRENWTVYLASNNSTLNPFLNDRFGYTVLSHTDLSRDGGMSGDVDLGNFHWGNYDLVVIDESHNFRNNTRGKRDEDGNVVHKSRYERLMEDIIRSGRKTRVLLLSATPVNNNLKDLRNQLYLLTEGQDDAFQSSLGIASLKETLANAQRTFTGWTKVDQIRDARVLLDKLDSAFFTLLDALTIARSRRHIQRYYAESVIRLGGFPERLPPVAVFPELDIKRRFMSYDRLNEEISQYKLALFNPAAYVLPEHAAHYAEREPRGARNFTQRDREHYLIGMMKVNFLKRLESSMSAFTITLARTIDKIEALLDRLDRFEQLRADPEFDVAQVEPDALDDDDLRAALEVGKAYPYQMAHLDLDAWRADLLQDLQQISLIYTAAKDVTPDRDAKLSELKRMIARKVTQPTMDTLGRPNRKVLTFTAFADTAYYVYTQLRTWAREELGLHIALVTGGARENQTTLGRNDFNAILTNFSPVSKHRDQMPGMPQVEQIDLLIATDCISEGQNLQDCDYLINYDIHWNPVRIIQRFGRIDRIGSINAAVQLVNFWPTPDLNRYIQLKNRVEARMALVDIAATMEDNLLAPDDITGLIADDLTYRDRQLLRLKDEILDLEDFNETVALSAFTLDDFRVELMKFLEANRRLLQDAPLGLYAVVPPPLDVPQIQPGVIYCLQQKGETSDGTPGDARVNPLQPFFLVYVWDDGTVRFGFAQPKQILDIYRELCLGKTAPYQALCDLFDAGTQNGEDMVYYNTLLDRAVASIEHTFKKRAAAQLVNAGRGGMLMERKQQVTQTTDFTLVTWLVIK
ncbi:MAG: ATP-dependent helicase [Anaerolineae bacterium]|nr:ATP-dependent helicase [Anaerolineae bacterium]